MLHWIDDYIFTNVYFVTLGVPSILTAFWLLAAAWTFRAEKKGK
ncbi:MAG: hypothetical protein ACQEXE_01670 [Bacillota bacterium]|nr:hypothetical protein [Cytobacillus firmus]MCU1804776.1 hypothetical protein [Cytobacillus firmus]WHY35632.1 hypothetical protein QNH44_07795 [Cytobacillus firmus]